MKKKLEVSDVVLLINIENILDRARKFENNQKETAKILGMHNGERSLGKFNIHRTHQRKVARNLLYFLEYNMTHAAEAKIRK